MLEYRTQEAEFSAFVAEFREREKVHLEKRKRLQVRIKMLLRSYGYNGWQKPAPWKPFNLPVADSPDCVCSRVPGFAESTAPGASPKTEIAIPASNGSNGHSNGHHLTPSVRAPGLDLGI